MNQKIYIHWAKNMNQTFFETAVRIKISEIKNLLKLLFSFSKQKNKITSENLLGPRAVPQK